MGYKYVRAFYLGTPYPPALPHHRTIRPTTLINQRTLCRQSTLRAILPDMSNEFSSILSEAEQNPQLAETVASDFIGGSGSSGEAGVAEGLAKEFLGGQSGGSGGNAGNLGNLAKEFLSGQSGNQSSPSSGGFNLSSVKTALNDLGEGSPQGQQPEQNEPQQEEPQEQQNEPQQQNEPPQDQDSQPQGNDNFSDPNQGNDDQDPNQGNDGNEGQDSGF